MKLHPVRLLLLLLAMVGLLRLAPEAAAAGREIPPQGAPSASERRQILNFLGSENVQDILEGLARVDRIPWEQAKPSLLRLATHPDAKVAARALEILVAHREPEASPLVRQNIAHAIQPKARVAAIHQLGKLENPADFPFFLRLLDIENLETRLAVISWIGKLKIPNAVLPLVQILEDSRDAVRAEALQALAAVSRRHAVLPIIARLSDTSLPVRKTAISLLAPEDLNMARHALVRLLQTGTREERLAILKILPVTREIRPYLLDLLRSSKPEEIPQVLSLFSGDIDTETLQDLVNLASSGAHGPALQEIIPRIRVEDPSILPGWILSSGSNYNIRLFCGSLLAVTDPAQAEEVLRRAWRIGHFTGEAVARLYETIPAPLPLGLMTEIFEQGGARDKQAVVEAFIRHRDDRLGPLLLAKLPSDPSLEPLLLPYARETGSRIFIHELLERLTRPDLLSRRDVLLTLKKMVETEAQLLVDAGSLLSGDDLILWSDILWEHLDAKILQKLDRLPITSPELEREMAFLSLAAVQRGMEPPARFRKFRMPARPLAYHLWLAHAISPGAARIPAGLETGLAASFLDLVPDGPPPAGISPQSPDPRMVQAAARFDWPAPILEAWLEAPNPCVRINAARAYARSPRKRMAFLLARMERETHPLVVFNLLRGMSSPDARAVEILQALCRRNTETCKAYLPGMAASWPEELRRRFEELGPAPAAAGPAPRNALVRFHFPALPGNLACIAVGSPADGVRAMTVPADNDLAVLHLSHPFVTLHPVYQ